MSTKEIRYDCVQRVGTIISDGRDEAVGASVIQLFQRIDPKVERVEVVNDDGPYAVFVRDEVGVWSSAP